MRVVRREKGTQMPVELAGHVPFIAMGFVVGLVAFLPLYLALAPVLAHRRDANMAVGMLGIMVSFAVLFMGVVIVHLVVPAALIAFLCGELAGFLICWIVIACMVIMRD